MCGKKINSKSVIFESFKNKGYTKELTVSFIRQTGSTVGENFLLGKNHWADCERMMKAYLNKLERKISHKNTIETIAIFEHKTENGDETYAHYHCMLKITPKMNDDFVKVTNEYWDSIGHKNYGAPIHRHIDEIRDADHFLEYALKNVDEDYPIDRILTREAKA